MAAAQKKAQTPRYGALAGREAEAERLLCEGRTRSEVAAALGVTRGVISGFAARRGLKAASAVPRPALAGREEEAERMIKEGRGGPEIAAALGVPVGCIHGLAAARGLKIRPRRVKGAVRVKAQAQPQEKSKHANKPAVAFAGLADAGFAPARLPAAKTPGFAKTIDPAKIRPPRAERAPAVVHDAPPVPFADLGHGQCRFEVGGGAPAANFLFCGAPRLLGRPFCAGHAQIAYIPIRDKRARALLAEGEA